MQFGIGEDVMRAAVHGIGVLASGLEGWDVCREVLAHARPYRRGAVPDPEASILPPNERRRSSDCVRWAVQVAQEAIDQSGLDPREVPTVFASSGGEMGVFDQLCRVLASEDRRVSPTLFHQSVHNTAAGYWGIATAGQQSSTALSCYDDSFAAGWLEAMTMVLSEQRAVLLVAYDMAVPAPLNEARPVTEGFAVAFVLGPPLDGSTMVVRMSLEQANGKESIISHDQDLERLRIDNPAARSLPLLRAIAKTDQQSVSLALLGSQQLRLNVESCRPSTKTN